MSLSFPSLQAAIAGAATVAPTWAKWFRELHAALNAEQSPGRICPFYLSAADLADATQFIQGGATAGLGVGTRLGWALCNGNNGTPTLNDTFLRWSTSAAGTTGGSDTQTHTVSGSSGAGTTHSHGAGTLQADCLMDSSGFYAALSGSGFAVDYKQSVASTYSTPGGNTNNSADVSGSTGAESSHTHPSGTLAADSADNRPAFKTLVPLMRLA